MEFNLFKQAQGKRKEEKEKKPEKRQKVLALKGEMKKGEKDRDFNIMFLGRKIMQLQSLRIFILLDSQFYDCQKFN